MFWRKKMLEYELKYSLLIKSEPCRISEVPVGKFFCLETELQELDHKEYDYLNPQEVSLYIKLETEIISIFGNKPNISQDILCRIVSYNSAYVHSISTNETLTIYVTLDALEHGIRVCQIKSQYAEGNDIFVDLGIYQEGVTLGENAFLTEEEAVRKVSEMRLKKLADLETALLKINQFTPSFHYVLQDEY
jgi:hypothetical protein